MPWQQHTADVGLEVDEDGRFCYQLVIDTVPRQSGKTTLHGAVMDQRAATVPRGHVWFTMQTAKDAVDWLLNEHWPLLAPLDAAVTLRRQAGSENVRWKKTGGLIRPFPPNATGLHSKTSDLVVVDECWAFDLMRGRDVDQGIVPTQATRPNAQVWKTSTAGDAAALWWLGTVEAGRAAVEAGRREGVAYFEWSCPDDLDPCEEASWPQYHPAYGRTIDARAMRAALEILGPDEFARAYGNRWVSMVARVIPLQAWRAVQDENAPMPERGKVALAFDVAIDRSDAAIAAAWRDETGMAHIEIADVRPGVGWLTDRCAELVDKWAPVAFGYDAAGPAIDVADVLVRHGLALEPTDTTSYIAACQGFLEAIVSGGVKVRPNEDLDAAAAVAARRSVADRWAWGRRQSGTSIATLTAATGALWAYDHAPPALGDFRVY